MGMQNELEGQNFLHVVNNEILLGSTVILGFSTPVAKVTTYFHHRQLWNPD